MFFDGAPRRKKWDAADSIPPGQVVAAVAGRDVVANVPDLFGSRDARAFGAEAARGQLG